jgi:hypothetical protein
MLGDNFPFVHLTKKLNSFGKIIPFNLCGATFVCLILERNRTMRQMQRAGEKTICYFSKSSIGKFYLCIFFGFNICYLHELTSWDVETLFFKLHSADFFFLNNVNSSKTTPDFPKDVHIFYICENACDYRVFTSSILMLFSKRGKEKKTDHHLDSGTEVTH